MRGKILAVATVTVAAVMVPGTAAAATARFAAPGGSTTDPNCDATHPCEIHRALETISQPGDDVTIEPGSYALTSSLVPGATHLAIHGRAGAARPRITVSTVTAGAAFELSVGSTLRHVQLDDTQATSTTGLDGAGGNLLEDDVLIAHASNSSAAVVSGGSTIRDSIIHMAGAGSTHSVALQTHDGNVVVRNATVVADATDTWGIAAFATAPDKATARLDMRNTIVTTQSDPSSFDLVADASTSTPSAVVDVSSSNFRTTALKGTGGTKIINDLGGNQPAAPVFTDAAAGGYHQASSSPTIDKGVTDEFIGPIDIDGQPRVLGPAPDIGADEFAGPPVVATTAPATGIGNNGATLRGSVNSHGFAATYYFEFGKTKSYGLQTAAKSSSAAATIPVSAGVKGLTPGTTFHYRLVAATATSRAVGQDRTFKTTGLANPKPGPCANTFKGTNGPNKLTGSGFGDRLIGLGGADSLKGLGGDDCLDGGKGKDSFDAGAGNDKINSADGVKETVECGKGRDTVTADTSDKLKHCEVVKLK